MKKKSLIFLSLLAISMPLASCSGGSGLEIELDEFTPTAYLGEEYDFTDVLYVEEGVEYKLEVYYQNYKTMKEYSLPVVDTFYFTPIDIYDLTVIVNATRGSETAKRTRHVPVSLNVLASLSKINRPYMRDILLSSQFYSTNLYVYTYGSMTLLSLSVAWY